MKLSTMQTLVDYQRRDLTESFVSDAEIKAYLNEGLRRVNAETNGEWQKTSASFSFSAGSSIYQLSAIASDLDEVIDIFYTDNYNFEMISPEDFRRLSASAAGYNIYSIDNNHLLVNTSFGDATLQLHYYSTNTAQTSGGSWIGELSATTDEPLLYNEFQDTIVDFAVARCHQKEGMVDDYQIAYNNFIRGLSRAKEDYPSRKQRPLRRMKSINEYTARKYIPFGKDNCLNQ